MTQKEKDQLKKEIKAEVIKELKQDIKGGNFDFAAYKQEVVTDDIAKAQEFINKNRWYWYIPVIGFCIYMYELNQTLTSKDKLTASYTFHKKNKLATRILLQLELYILDRLETNSYNLNLKNPSLEHIMPRTNDEWLKDLKNQIKEGELVEEEFQKHLNMIGNFIVVPKPINSSMKKAPFLKKQTKLTKFNVPLIKGDDDLGIESFDNFQEWTFENIRTRTETLSKIILKEVYPFKI